MVGGKSVDQTYMLLRYFVAEEVLGGKLTRKNIHTSVAAHVHADTIPEAINPGLTLLEALENSSEDLGENAVYRACIAVIRIMNALKNRPIPVTFKLWVMFKHHDHTLEHTEN